MPDLCPLPPESLYRLSDLRHLPFDTTDDLESLAGIFGQERAREAIDLGVGLRARGYNVFADTSVTALADAARMTACDVLVLGSDVFPRERGEFRSLLERIRCPVVLVG